MQQTVRLSYTVVILKSNEGINNIQYIISRVLSHAYDNHSYLLVACKAIRNHEALPSIASHGESVKCCIEIMI